MSYKLNGIDIQYLLESGGTNNFTQYTGTNRPTYKRRDANNNIEELTHPLNYKINSIDINTDANAYSQLYTAVGSTSVSTLIQGTTNSYYKHISAVIVGGGGGGGGAGGNGTKSGGSKTSGGAGGSGAPSNVVVIHNKPLNNNNNIIVTVGLGGAGGSRGTDQGAPAGKGNDAGDGLPGGISSITVGTTTYGNTVGATGGGGGNAGTANTSGDQGASYTASPDNNADVRTYDSYKVSATVGAIVPGAGGPGKGNNDAPGNPGQPGQVKVWFLYQN